jgi:hypothetical protein
MDDLRRLIRQSELLCQTSARLRRLLAERAENARMLLEIDRTLNSEVKRLWRHLEGHPFSR